MNASNMGRWCGTGASVTKLRGRWKAAVPIRLASRESLAPRSGRGGRGLHRGADGTTAIGKSGRPGGAGAGGSGNSGGSYGTGGVDPTGTTYVASESVGAPPLASRDRQHGSRRVRRHDSRPATKFLIEDEFTPYDNDYTLQQASRALIDSLEALAEDVAERALADPAQRAQIVPCTPSGPGDSACFRQVIETLGRRVFRRALRDEEITRYLTLQSFATENNPYVTHDFYTAVELFIRSMLQDPEFLYRIEVGTPTATPGIFALDSYEIAARLSYLLWGSTPDDALLSDAEAGIAHHRRARGAIAERMLRRSARATAAPPLPRDVARLPRDPAPAELVAAFNEETTQLIDRVDVRRAAGLPRALPRQGDLPRRLPRRPLRPAAAGGRRGLGALRRQRPRRHPLARQRARRVQQVLRHQPHPARHLRARRGCCAKRSRRRRRTSTSISRPATTMQVCKYDRYSAHREIASCARCHGQMDPIGFGLENYDIAGRYRTHDDGLPRMHDHRRRRASRATGLSAARPSSDRS